MARMPGATWNGPHHDNGVMRKDGPNVVCFHTIVGHDPAPAAHFSVGAYGELTQSRDTEFQSAANYQGNPRVIAVETEDTGEPFPQWSSDHDVPAWTDAQVERCAEIAAWCYREHGIPLVLAADSKVGSAGVAYHRMGIDGNFAAEGFAYGGRVSGGEHWSTSTGKACPGDARITQVIEKVIARARALAGLEAEVSDPKLDYLMARQYAIEQMQRKISSGPNAQAAGIVGEPVRVVQEMWYAFWRLYRFIVLNADQGGGDAPPSEGPLPAIDAIVYTRDTVKQISEAITGLSVAGADPAVIADHLASNEEWTNRLADAIAAAQDRRARDGDRTTGPVT